jgi:hypothetical protein
LEEKWEVWKRNLKNERMTEGESGAGIRVQMRMTMNKSMKDNVELKEVRVGMEDMMQRKECCSRKTGRWRLMRRLDSEEEEKDRRMPREKIKR